MTQVVDLAAAEKLVAHVLEERKRWGKFFSIGDMPPEFLDALVLVHEAQQGAILSAEMSKDGLIKQLNDQVVLLNRQLGAAKARETGLRKQLATKPAEGPTNDDLRQAAAGGE